MVNVVGSAWSCCYCGIVLYMSPSGKSMHMAGVYNLMVTFLIFIGISGHHFAHELAVLVYLGRLRRVDLIIWVRCPSVCLSTKSFSDSDEIWYVGRGR